MDFTELRKSIWVGFLAGMTTMMSITIIAIPTSYVMNKFSYHAAPMRFMLGFITAVFSLASFVIVTIAMISGNLKPVHYFGLFPIVTTGESVEPTGYFAFLFKILTVFIHPFYFFYTGSDVEGYKSNIEQILVKGVPEAGPFTLNGSTVSVTKGAVCEEFFEGARMAGAVTKKAGWEAALGALKSSEIGPVIFSE